MSLYGTILYVSAVCALIIFVLNVVIYDFVFLVVVVADDDNVANADNAVDVDDDVAVVVVAAVAYCWLLARAHFWSASVVCATLLGTELNFV